MQALKKKKIKKNKLYNTIEDLIVKIVKKSI